MGEKVLAFLALITAGLWLALLLLRLFVLPQLRPGQEMLFPATILAATSPLGFGAPQMIIALAMFTVGFWLTQRSEARHPPVAGAAEAASVLGLTADAEKAAVKAAYGARRQMAQRLGAQPALMRRLAEARDLLIYGQIVRF